MAIHQHFPSLPNSHLDGDNGAVCSWKEHIKSYIPTPAPVEKGQSLKND